MRSSLLPRRPLRRVCDSCRQQQQRNHAPSPNFRQAAALSTIAPSKTTSPRQTANASPTPAAREAPPRAHIRNVPQFRHISTSAASLARPAEAAQPAQPSPEAEVTIQDQEEEAGDGIKPKPTPAPIKTHYDLFPQTLPSGPPPSGPFAIDLRALRREFLTLQATAHPDVAPAGLPAKRRAEAASSLINEAYRTLSSPLLRAQYLLHLSGHDVANDETGKVADPNLLMLVLETREAIEEARSEEELEPLRVENEGRIRESEDRLGQLFGEGDVEGARGEVVRLRYWVNIRDTIRDWERGKPVVLQH
ncbi:Co-chaperone Hsc20 [Annulohypoxylon truncatum]|uniref:Co-chaperone Hsc20 n=1 Tax=Annulohypoxylon truncatum TaxID=327061 RepID=UPI0020082960|nr:Co-chaperone Hsc20 [Annulohypoxylon truncatum]KAI1214190.1 Co-chaperone Hsc20 [Annulohypoxylon truncatum]